MLSTHMTPFSPFYISRLCSVKVNSGKCGPKGACNASACGHGPMDNLVAGSTAEERGMVQGEERAGEEHPGHGNAKAKLEKRRLGNRDSTGVIEA